MNAEELMQKYQQLTAQPLDLPSKENESSESVVTLLQSSSLRILLLRTLKEPETVSIEVEIWLPGNNSDTGPVNSSYSSATLENKKLGVLLSEMINHLQYLLRLHQSGFVLDVIKHDCLWTASKTFKKPPRLEVFDLLLPP
jgi:hypothetical protein